MKQDAKSILFTFPTDWDRKQLPLCRAVRDGRVVPVYGEPAHGWQDWDLDILEYIEEECRLHRDTLAGVLSTSDYPGTSVAAILSRRLGVAGPEPELTLRLSHKYFSRALQKEAVPEATPDFWLVDPDGEPPSDLRYPCFLKPVKGTFSMHTGRIRDAGELKSFLGRRAIDTFRRETMAIFNTLAREFGSPSLDGGKFIAEGVLSGVQVTVEGWVQEGKPRIFGIVDSVVDPETNSFVRFDYPSSLPAPVQERMKDIARRLIAHSRLDDTVFNLEMFYEESTDTVSIIEVNPRLCGQFADLYQKVDGTSSYNVALNVALGRKPRFDRGDGPFDFAASVPLRIFRPSRVVAAPDDETVARVAKAHPGSLIWSEVETGMELIDFETEEDGKSSRYAIINLGAAGREELLDKVEEIREELGFVFEEDL